MQRLVFPQLTTIAYLPKASAARAPFVEAFLGRPDVWRGRGEQILQPLAAAQESRGVLISAETISAHRLFAAPTSSSKNIARRAPSTLAHHLRECQTQASKLGLVPLRVIMGIRSQDQYLGSRYGSQGAFASHPGQADFESQVRDIIGKRYSSDGIWLDYKMSYDLITAEIGASNLLVLPLEQLTVEPAKYLGLLAAFLGEPLKGSSLRRTNSRSPASDVWQIEKQDLQKATRKKPFGWYRARLAREVEFRLTPDLNASILAAYRESNLALSQALKVNLGQYGILLTQVIGLGSTVPTCSKYL